VLRDVDLEVQAGSLLAVLGRNGAGKTTLVKAVMGLGVRTAGDVVFDGTVVSGKPTHVRARAGMQLVPEDRRIYPMFDVRANLQLGTHAAARGALMSLDEILDLFPSLQPLVDRGGHELSGGEQELVAIARAIMPRPRLLIMDEPSQGLSPRVLETVGEAIGVLRRELSTTVVLTEQNVRFALAHADHVAVLDEGTIASFSTRDEFVADAGIARRHLGATT
jgi:ABC-type branched-subunit amino acid transport system ATPase component